MLAELLAVKTELIRRTGPKSSGRSSSNDLTQLVTGVKKLGDLSAINSPFGQLAVENTTTILNTADMISEMTERMKFEKFFKGRIAKKGNQSSA